MEHLRPNDAGAPLLAEIRDAIDAYFHADSVVDILSALGAVDTEWARKQVDIINTKSPTSSAVAPRQMRDGVKTDFNGCMQIEMRAVTRLMAPPIFTKVCGRLFSIKTMHRLGHCRSTRRWC